MPLPSQMKIHLPAFMQKCFSRIPHRVVVYALATGVIIFATMQCGTFYLCLDEMVSMKLAEYHATNCTFIATSSGQDHAERVTPFKWNESEILGMVQFFAIGQLLAIIPSGFAVGAYGAKPVFLFGFLLSSVTTLLFPHMAFTGSHELQAGRMIQGIGQGVLYSSLAAIIAHWAPTSERNTLGSITQTGRVFGYYSSVTVCQLIPMLKGQWEVKFYLASAVSVLWFVVCWYFLCSQPTNCTHITHKEKMFIYFRSEGIDRRQEKEWYPVLFPWMKMFGSIPFLSLVLYSSALSSLHYVMRNKFQEYCLSILHLDLPMTHMIKLVLLLSVTMSTLLCGVISDMLINKNYITREFIRKLLGYLALFLTVPLIVGVITVGCDVTVVVALITALFYAQGLLYYNLSILPIDLSPQYAAGVTAVVSFVDQLSVLLFEVLFQVFVKKSELVSSWVTMGSLLTALVCVCTLQFLWLGSAEVQPWNYDYLLHSPYLRARSYSMRTVADLLTPTRT